ncbi:MAG: LysM peptidoglycan-binding domain-containing protein, partial [Polyangiales bacterium]
MPKHTVTQGECLTSIADRYGFYWQTLWNDPENEHLQKLGRHPNALLPGDVVNIPEKRIKRYIRQTGARYTWKVKGIPAKLRLELLWDDEPRASEPFVLTVDGAVIEGTTDAAGRLEVTIPPGAVSGRLKVGEGDRE